MRRKEGALVPLEMAILSRGLYLRNAAVTEFHGFQLAKALREGDQARGLTAHGTLYKALDRLERMGLLESRWEDAEIAVASARPRRRLYRITGDGERALDRELERERTAALRAGAIGRALA